jgi:hypothetical protein
MFASGSKSTVSESAAVGHAFTPDHGFVGDRSALDIVEIVCARQALDETLTVQRGQLKLYRVTLLSQVVDKQLVLLRLVSLSIVHNESTQ